MTTTAMAPGGLRVLSSAPAAFRQMGPLPSPVRLGTPARRQAPRPRPYRAPYRPSMISNAPAKKQMGALSDVPMSLGLGAAGMGAMLLSGIIPQPIKTILQVTGVGLIAFGAITLVTPAADAAETEETAATFPIGDPSDFQAVTAKITSPKYNQEVPRGLFSSDYDVEVLWTNPTDKDLTVPFQIYVEEEPSWGIFAEPFKGVAYTGVVSLPARQAKLVPMEIDLQYRGFGEALAVGMKLVVQKISPAGQIFDVASTTFFVY